jgi:hypothetical protein
MINGILVGIAVAWAQSLLSMMALRRVLRKRIFYWVWFGGIFARLLVLALTAVVVSRYTHLNLAATLLSLVVATMVFLILEAQSLRANRQ